MITANELRQVLRSLFKRPWPSMVIILIIAVGIGVGSAFYSIGEEMLLRPLPFDPAGRLMAVQLILQPSGDRRMNSQQNLDDLGEQSQTLDGVSVFQAALGTLTANGQTQYAVGMKVDRHFFPLLGVPPALGRAFTSDDEQPGAPGTIILSYAYWQRRFQGDSSVLGKSLLLNQQPYTVIGVMPQLFYFPFVEFTEEDFWQPLQLTPQSRRGNYDKHGIARIKAGATLPQAEAEAAQIAQHISIVYPQMRFTFHLQNYREKIVEGLRPILFILAGIMLCVQLIVCINVASLLLVEAMRYRREVEIRFSLGGTRWKIARLFLLRALMLAFAGGIAGAALAGGLVLMTRRLLPSGFPGAEQITLDTTLLWITVLVSLGTGIIFGLWPALAATKRLHKISLHRAGQAAQQSSATSTMRRSRKSLVTLQLAFSSAFLVVTVLLGMSFYHLLNVNLGIRIDHRLLVEVRPDPSVKTDAARDQFDSRMEEQLRAIPGVEDVTVSSDVPLMEHGKRDFRIQDAIAPQNSQEWIANAEKIGTNYFEVLGMPVLKGRSFTEQDAPNGPPVAIVNEAFAKRFFGDVSPLGKKICIPDACPWREIVGVVADAHDTRIDGHYEPAYYVPFWQAQREIPSNATFIVHTRTPPASVIKPIQEEIKLALGDVGMGPVTLEEMRSRQLMGARYSVWFLATIALLALLLAAMGVYGVIAGDTEQRRHEIGIRMALGATPQNIAALFQRQMLFMLVPGLLLGLGLAAVLVRYTTSILFGIAPIDPLAYGAAALVLSAVAAMSTALPVRRALRESPSDVLRAE